MLSHDIVNVSHVTSQLSSIDDVTNAIDVQVAKNKGDLKQEIVIISQLHVINVQWLRDLDRLAVRWNTTDICSYSPIGMRIYSYWDGDDAKDRNTCSLWWFSIDESEIQDVAAP